MVRLPYRYVYAIATQDSVYLYDTQQTLPLAFLSQLHYSTFTDLAWSHTGNCLFVTSTDGFGSLAVFEPGELGEPYIDNNEIAGTPQENSLQVQAKSPTISLEKPRSVQVLHEGIIKKRRIEPILISQ